MTVLVSVLFLTTRVVIVHIVYPCTYSTVFLIVHVHRSGRIITVTVAVAIAVTCDSY